MLRSNKLTELVSDIKEHRIKFKAEVYAEKIIEFAEEYHKEKLKKKLPKEVILNSLEKVGKKIAHNGNVFKRKNWDNAVQIINENYDYEK